MFLVDVYNGKLLEKFLVKQRTIVITGGGRGLGLTFANGLAQAGANIAVVDIAEQPSPWLLLLIQVWRQIPILQK